MGTEQGHQGGLQAVLGRGAGRHVHPLVQAQRGAAGGAERGRHAGHGHLVTRYKDKHRERSQYRVQLLETRESDGCMH